MDAMGLLEGFYAQAKIAFVGGSLVPVGGHNLLEPAAYGVPVLTGPHLQNFREITNALDRSGGCRIVQDLEALSNQIRVLCNDESVRSDMGRAGRNVSASARGASERNKVRILGLLDNRQTGFPKSCS